MDKLGRENLDALKQKLVDKWAAEMSYDELLEYYREGTFDFLADCDEEQLLVMAKHYLGE